MIDLKTLGKICADARRRSNIYQIKVSFDTCYSVENVSCFEHGRNDNARILLWYIKNVLTIEEMRKIYEAMDKD